MLKTRRQCVRTIVSHAAWSPSRQRWITWSIACAEDESKGTERAHDNMRTYVSAPYSQGKHGLACDGVALAAIAQDVGTPNAESPGELDRIAAVAAAAGRTARVALRVNPDIDAKTHANISTGLRINKFGVALEDARAIYRDRRDRKGLRFVGVHV